ncbi:MAG TPA: MAPEG family protein [Rhizomicrobium sp.]|nr:MAPEG family protein [Rhizomicrobium sp.]
MNSVPVTILSAAVTILAVLVYFYTGINVGRMRAKHGVKAPAVTGAPEFERAYRVQLNTLEQFAVFLPLLWVATLFPISMAYLAPAFGLVWVVGRILYMQAYMADPEKRGTGFTISSIASLALLILCLVGLTRAWLAVHAA